jgi:spore coat protein F
MQFGDKEILLDLINDESEMIKLYSAGLAESTCPNMRQILLKNIGQAEEDQYTVFSRINNLGYDQAKPADKSEVDQAKRRYAQIQQQL